MVERSLFEKAKKAEHTRQKQSQTIRQLQKSLAETKQQNALKLQAELAEITKQEHDLMLQIQKEKAALEKVCSCFNFYLLFNVNGDIDICLTVFSLQ